MLEIETKLAVKDIGMIPVDQIKEMFAYAYRRHEKDRPPYTKEILEYWKSREGRQGFKVSGCGECSNGLISTDKIKKGRDVHGKEVDLNYGHTFRCSCSAGDQLDKEIVVWNNQRGYIKK